MFFRPISQIMGATTFLGVFMPKKHKSEKKIDFSRKNAVCRHFYRSDLRFTYNFHQRNVNGCKIGPRYAKNLKQWPIPTVNDLGNPMKPSKKLLTLIKTPIFSVKLNFFEKNCCRKKIIGWFRKRCARKNAQNYFLWYGWQAVVYKIMNVRAAEFFKNECPNFQNECPNFTVFAHISGTTEYFSMKFSQII